ncbi:hypothetical protein VTL71DRAFT_15448 [Oculimacula yallundae]|uniref:2EXR domain-containing protein n=1 Tax=Oculimacula yallundae TaxID=86028 RepID=A0ABR4CGM1_9HELO
MPSTDDVKSARGTTTHVSPNPGEFGIRSSLMGKHHLLYDHSIPESDAHTTSRTVENAPQVCRDSLIDGSEAAYRSSFPSDANTAPDLPHDSKDGSNAVDSGLPKTVIISSSSFELENLSAKAIPSSPSPDSSLSTKSETEVEQCALKTFMLFPKLPVELRLRVWKEAYPNPRWIEIHFDTAEDYWWTCCNSERSALFAICHESRTEILKTHVVL